MNEEEFNRNRLRFGEDVSTWPAPYRQDALRAFPDLLGTADDQEAMLDRLILEAADMETDELLLTRNVIRRLRKTPRTGQSSSLWHFLLRPAGTAACAALILAIFAGSGYQMARLQDEALDSALFALAAGAPFSEELTADPLNGGEPL